MTVNELSASLGSTSSSLLARIRDRDAEAWHRLVSLYTPLIYYWCRDAGLQTSDLRDVIQDSFRSVFEHFHSFSKDKSGATFRGWLRVIVRNKLNDLFRRQKREPVGMGGSETHLWINKTPDENSGNSSDPDAASETILVLRRALAMIQNDFTPITWQAFWRTAVEGQETRHVASDLGLNIAAVRQARSRVLKRLRSEFEGLVD
jgi:RNA polymerase sigma-70 factor (ECF subfamily)